MIHLTHKAIAIMCGFKIEYRSHAPGGGSGWCWVNELNTQYGPFADEAGAAYACCVANGLVQR